MKANNIKNIHEMAALIKPSNPFSIPIQQSIKLKLKTFSLVGFDLAEWNGMDGLVSLIKPPISVISHE